MTARATIAVLAMFIGTCAALAQGEPRRPAERRMPAEKFSPRPVQPQMNVAPVAGDLTLPKDEQKRRWEERSREPSVQPR